MRCLHFSLVFCCLAALFAFSTPLFAQAPNQPAYAGGSEVLYPSSVDNETDGQVGYWTIGWTASGTSHTESGKGGATTNADGWAIVRSGQGYKVTAPSNATLASTYTFSYTYSSSGKTLDTYVSYGDSGNFSVVALPPTMPLAGNPAFSWQGSVAGVNTGNGNKTTTLPITGWTMRGGMGVSCALYHNSQGVGYGAGAYKWTPSYFSFISGGSSAPVIHWDNGLTYSYTLTNGKYIPPYGILDTLTYSSGVWTLTTPGKTVYTFGYSPSNSYLSAITDMDGNTLSINHNSDTTLSTVTDSTSRTLTYTYSGGHLVSITDPLGRVWSFLYASGSYLQNVVLPPVNGQTYSLFFGYGDGRQNITVFTNARGQSSNYVYNSNNSLSKATDPAGNPTTFTYNANNTVITDPNGHTTTHTYYASRLTSVTDATNKYSTSTTYDYNNIATSTTDKRGYTWNNSSHLSNLTITSTSTDPIGYASSSTYDANNKVTQSMDALGNTTVNTYTNDSKEDLLTTTVTGTGSSPFTAKSAVGGYSYGLPTAFTDPLSNPSSITYDANGYPNSATDANHNPSSAVYNALGWKLSSTDAANHKTSYTYDAWGRVTVITAPDGTQTSTVYDADGNVLRVADADAYAAAPLYALHCYGNAAGRFTADGYASGGYGSWAASAADLSGAAFPAPQVVYSTQRVGTFTYTLPNLTPGQLYTVRLHFVESGHTAPGQRLFNVAINGGAALTGFDIFAAAGATNKAVVEEFNSPANSSGQLVIAFTPGAADVPVCSGVEVLPFVHTVANSYDADDRLAATFSGTGNGNGDVVAYAYDGTDPVSGVSQKGLLSSKTDGNNHTTKYSYSVRNEPLATYYPDGTSESVTYDANGNVNSRTKADGKVISYTYDADNRLTDITYPTLPAVHFDYDADGRRTHMHDGTGDTYWTFGDGLHLTQQGSGRGTVTYSYDLDGRRHTMGAPGLNPSNSMAQYIYGYDPGGRLTSLQNPFSETTLFGYNPDGTVHQKTLATGATITYGYDVAAQMTGLSFAWPGTSYSHSYTYTPAGELATRSESDGGTNTFSYDGADQLTSEVRTGPVPFSEGYTYDHNGNRLTQTVNGNLVQQFSYNAHDVLSTGINETPSWDLNGNMTGDTLNGQHTGYTYDDEDRLTSVTLPDGHTDSFSYNGLGMRLTKSDPTGNYAYLNDGFSPASDVLTDGYSTFTPGISETKGAAGGGYASVFYLADASGNSRGLLNGSNTNTDGYNWDAFGNLVSRFGSNPTMFAWNEASGYQSDSDDGLTLLGHRYYDKRTGRFISQDPAGAGGNWYKYAGNDPTDETDPTGQVAELVGSLNVPGTWSTEDITNFLSDNYQDGEYKVTNGTGSYNITINNAFSNSFMQGGMGLSMGNPGIFMQKGNVGHTDNNDAFQQKINDLKQKRHGGGLTPQERAALDKEINELEGKQKTNDKGSGKRRSRAQQFEADPSPFRINPGMTPPHLTPAQTGSASVSVGIIMLIILRSLMGAGAIP